MKPLVRRSQGLSFEEGIRSWQKPLALLGLAGLLLFQAFAYWDKLSLSLGPRVIFQPWLMRLGYIPYENIADQHSPLMPMVLAALTPVFSDGLVLAQIVLVVLISLSTLLTFLAGQRSIGWFGGLGAAFFFVLWSPVFGFGKLWHETFLAPIYVLLLLLYPSSASKRSLKSLVILGFLSGVAVLIKQYALVVVPAMVCWNAFTSWRARSPLRRFLGETVLLAASASLPIAAYSIYHYLQAGTLQSFLYWTVSFSYVSRYASLAAQLPTFEEIRVLAAAFLLIPAAVLTMVDLGRQGDTAWQSYALGLVLLGIGSLTIYPRFQFFHLQSVLPLLAWLSSTTLARALRPGSTSRLFAAGIALALLVLWGVTAGPVYPLAFQADQPRKVWEYSDLVPLAEEVRQQIGPTDRIYIFCDDEATANLYYLVQRPPPKFWTLSYPWYMQDWVKSRIVQTLEADPPEWVVYIPRRWDIETNAREVVSYIEGHYQPASRLDWAQGEVWLLKRNP